MNRASVIIIYFLVENILQYMPTIFFKSVDIRQSYKRRHLGLFFFLSHSVKVIKPDKTY